jgi:hypothetical protein
MRYKIVAKDELEDLEKVVNDLMVEGWRPVGGVSMIEIGEWVDRFGGPVDRDSPWFGCVSSATDYRYPVGREIKKKYAQAMTLLTY